MPSLSVEPAVLNALLECPQLPALVDSAKERFEMAEVSADRAYLSNENLTAIAATGAQPLVPFKLNSQRDGSVAWCKMHALFTLKQDEFLAAYPRQGISIMASREMDATAVAGPS